MSDPTIFDPSNAGYVQALWEEFTRNPESIPPEWRDYFAGDPQLPASDGLIPPDGVTGDGRREPAGGAAHSGVLAAPPAPAAQAPAVTPASVKDALASPEGRRILKVVAQATALVQALRDHGHQLAQIDPLGSEPPGHPQLDPKFFGLSSEDLRQIPASVVVPGGSEEGLEDTIARLREVYCGSIGYEFEHMGDPDKVRWLWEEVESGRHTGSLDDARKVALLERLTHVEGMERFLHRAYLGQKRFSIEGTDMLVPMLDVAVEEVGKRGGHEVIIGMAHRGRLNVLAHILGADYREFLRSFENLPHGETTLTIPDKGTGDVKYHHGARGEYQLPEGGTLTVALTPNPSHLEFVDPVVAGYARVRQFEDGSSDVTRDPRAVVPILIHGDAAFAGEGVVAETLNMARLEGYDVGGTIHIIANNQVGFTTDPTDSRSTHYASDLAKGFDIPIVHVNADDPQACVAAVKLAMAFRDRFEDDVVIDLVGYRRHGHNEGDEPGYTQPALYKTIGAHPTVRGIWAARLVADGAVSEEAAADMEAGFQDMMRDAQDEVRSEASDHGPDRHLDSPEESPDPDQLDTGVPMEVLAEVNRAAVAVPEGFTVHPKLKRQLDRRSGEFGEDTSLDWAQGEALALGTLLKDGVPIRMTGQDVERGTFSHRHVVLHDVETGETVTPLGGMGGARFEIYNSPLTETAVLGFEYGYSVGAESDLVLWEAQFGDFVNVGQVVIDQFIAAGEAKWGLHSNLTLLLPHGYEGQGPEHSSARLERFLQLCAENNMRVVYPSTPAQYFHLLRRQAMMRPARPLVVMTPKSLLRHPQAVSRPGELAHGRFQPVMQDPGAVDRAGEIQRIVLSSGKIHYDLLALRDSEKLDSVALVRLEELYPFPAVELRDTLSAYPAVKEIWWAQEEPRNMGALSFIGPRLRAVVPRAIPLKHASRPDRASPAEGSSRDHVEEQTRVVRTALGLEGEGGEES